MCRKNMCKGGPQRSHSLLCGVEVMAANGHQFLQDNSSKRTDQYGGSIENRTQLLVEIVEALIDVWGANVLESASRQAGRITTWRKAICGSHLATELRAARRI